MVFWRCLKYCLFRKFLRCFEHDLGRREEGFKGFVEKCWESFEDVLKVFCECVF